MVNKVKVCGLLLSVVLVSSTVVTGSNTVNIIPEPKKIILSKKEFSLTNALIILGKNSDRKSEIAAEEINKKVKELSDKTLLIRKETEVTKEDIRNYNLILIGTEKENNLLKRYLSSERVKIPEEEQGYLIHFLKRKGVVLIAGNDPLGTLYAAITFCQLIEKNNNDIFALKAEIKDWPDFISRGMSKGSQFYRRNVKGHIDWLVRHKFNLVFFPRYNKNPDFDPEHNPQRHRWSYWKEINDYASERGVKILYNGWEDLGYVPKECKNQKHYKGMIVFGERLFCWSNEKLIDEKCDRITKFCQLVHPGAIYFHCIDRMFEDWHKRCDKCRKKYGDDRASADAYIINKFYQACKKGYKDTVPMFVVQPYARYGGLNFNGSSKIFFEKLSKLIPKDAYITTREDARSVTEDWNKFVKQPKLIYHITLKFGEARFAKTFYFKENKDSYLFIAYSNYGALEDLLAIEYLWNVNSGGADYIPECYNINGSMPIGSVPEPDWDKTPLPKICDYLFDERGEDIQNILLSDLEPQIFVGRYYMQRHKEMTAKYFEDKLNKSKMAVKVLEEMKPQIENEVSQKVYDKIYLKKKVFTTIYKRVMGAKPLIEIRYHLFKADEYIKSGKKNEAEKEIKKAEKFLPAITNTKHKKILMKEIKSKKGMIPWMTIRKEYIKSLSGFFGGLIKVGIYDVKSSGATGIYNSLKGVTKIEASLSRDLSEDALKHFDVLIFSATTDMAGVMLDIPLVTHRKDNLIKFVRNGKGIIFTHNACGGRYPHYAFGKSLFPEINKGITGRLENKVITITKNSPITKDFKIGDTFIHSYYDHLKLSKGEKGKVLAVDKDNSPVIIAGKAGKGKVVFFGNVPGFDDNDQEVFLLEGEFKILLRAISWCKK